MLLSIFLCLAAYLLGSIPTSIWVSKNFFNIDIRDYGSHNAGATNSFRFLGKKWGLFIFLIDLLKGTLAVKLTLFYPALNTESTLLNFQLFLGFLAIVGHIFPVYAQFKGGKGVATLFGVIIGISPKFALVFAAFFFLTFLLTNYVALGSILASASFAFCIAFWIQQPNSMLAIVLSACCGLLIIIKHHTNIKRLFNKTETKMWLFKKTKEKVDKA